MERVFRQPTLEGQAARGGVRRDELLVIYSHHVLNKCCAPR